MNVNAERGAGNGERGKRNSEWMTVRLGEVVEVNPKRVNGDLTDDTIVGFVPMAAVCEKDKAVIAPETRSYSEVKKGYTPMRNGDVIVAKITPCFENGKVAVVDIGHEYAFGSTEFHVFRATGEVDQRLIYHLLRSKQVLAKGHDHMKGAAGQKRVPAEFFRAFEFRVPRSLSAQRRIAAILDKADAIRRKRRESLRFADQFLRSVFLDMFGDPVTNPKAFKKAPLGEVIRVKSGKGLIAKNMSAEGQYPVYGGNGINGYNDQYMFDEPTIVLGRVGIYCGAVYLTKPKSWITDNALYVAEYFQMVHVEYLVAALKYADLNQYAGRAAQPLISGSRIYPIEVLMPPLEIQCHFAAVVEQFEMIVTKLKNHLKKTESCLGALQGKAFGGSPNC